MTTFCEVWRISTRFLERCSTVASQERSRTCQTMRVYPVVKLRRRRF